MDLLSFARNQNVPPGALYIVATPIGNLADMTIRGIHILSVVDGIACEDKRHTANLLSSYGIQRPLMALHQHNEHEASELLLQKLKSGERWAYVSDAGTPGVSDPGAILVKLARNAGVQVIPIPGASAITALISASGELFQQQDGQFHFWGFLPQKKSQKDKTLKTIASNESGAIFYEAPHRIEETLRSLSIFFDSTRKVMIAKELTKLHETILVMSIQELDEWLTQPQNWQGEFVIAISGQTKKEEGGFNTEVTEWANLLEEKLGHKELSEILATKFSLPKKEVYDFLLQRKKQS